jgi:hypothetical protein
MFEGAVTAHGAGKNNADGLVQSRAAGRYMSREWCLVGWAHVPDSKILTRVICQSQMRPRAILSFLALFTLALSIAANHQ